MTKGGLLLQHFLPFSISGQKNRAMTLKQYTACTAVYFSAGIGHTLVCGPSPLCTAHHSCKINLGKRGLNYSLSPIARSPLMGKQTHFGVIRVLYARQLIAHVHVAMVPLHTCPRVRRSMGGVSQIFSGGGSVFPAPRGGSQNIQTDKAQKKFGRNLAWGVGWFSL